MNKIDQKLYINNKNQSFVCAAIVIFVIVIVFIGCDRTETQKLPKQMDKVTLGVGSGLFMTPVWVAENKGFFKKEGLDLIIKTFDTGKASLQDMLDGAIDISTLAPTPIMFASFDRKDFSIFATLSSSEENVKIITHKDSGINTANDLKGKRIGTTARTSAQFVLSSFLSYNGIPESDIVEVHISPPDLPQALKNAQVDAIVIWEPFAYNAKKLLQDKAINLPSSKIYKETFNLMVMKDFIRDNPEILEKFLRAIESAVIYIKSHKQESQALVAGKLKLDNDIIDALWDDFVFELSLNQNLLITLEDEARWAIKTGIVEKNEIPNYLDYIYIDALEKVKPDAVTIIR